MLKVGTKVKDLETGFCGVVDSVAGQTVKVDAFSTFTLPPKTVGVRCKGVWLVVATRFLKEV